MRSRRLRAIAVVLALATAGCGEGGDPTSSSERASATGAASPLAFSSPAIGGGRVEGATFQGRPTLLWFWAPW